MRVLGFMTGTSLDAVDMAILETDGEAIQAFGPAGERKLSEATRRLALQARDLTADLSSGGGSVSYRWIPREQNKAADALSNDGMDGAVPARVTETPATAQPNFTASTGE